MKKKTYLCVQRISISSKISERSDYALIKRGILQIGAPIILFSTAFGVHLGLCSLHSFRSKNTSCLFFLVKAHGTNKGYWVLWDGSLHSFRSKNIQLLISACTLLRPWWHIKGVGIGLRVIAPLLKRKSESWRLPRRSLTLQPPLLTLFHVTRIWTWCVFHPLFCSSSNWV